MKNKKIRIELLEGKVRVLEDAIHSLFEINKISAKILEELTALAAENKDLTTRIEVLEFKAKYGRVKTELKPVTSYKDGEVMKLTVSFVTPNDECVQTCKPVSLKDLNDTNVLIVEDTKYESIINIDDLWMKLDKRQGCLVDIPKPAKFVEETATEEVIGND